MTLKILGNEPKGLVFVVSAPAGTGKTTLVQMLQEEFDSVSKSISYTTREPRKDEIPGTHYNFVSTEEFKGMIEKGVFLEYAKVFGHYYGTSREYVEKQQEAGKHVILVIDTQGARQLKDKIEAVYIFISPPSLEDLEERLELRKTETEEIIEKRLSWAKKEIETGKTYDYFIINEKLEIAYQVLRAALIAEEHRIRHKF